MFESHYLLVKLVNLMSDIIVAFQATKCLHCMTFSLRCPFLEHLPYSFRGFG